MSTGIVKCSKCSKEVHQEGEDFGYGKHSWIHCESNRPMCEDASAEYVHKISDIVGKWCGKDEA